MAIFKSLSPDDVSRVPFNANKLFRFTSSSAATAGFTTETFEYTSSILDTFSSASTDTKNVIKYYQLDHLFYKNNQLDIANRLGDADYLVGNRTLYDKVNVISIPSNLYGNKIKPGTFIYSSSNGTIIDDSKGNLILSDTNLTNHSIDEREKIFHLGPVKGFKQYNLNYDLYGKVSPYQSDHYTRESVYDDSFYNNTLDYKKIKFKKENLSLSLITEYGHNPNFALAQTGIEELNWVVNSQVTQTPTSQGIKFSTTTSSTIQYPSIRVNNYITLTPYAKYRVTLNVFEIPVSYINLFLFKTIQSTSGSTQFRLFNLRLDDNTIPTPGEYTFEFQYIPNVEENYDVAHQNLHHRFLFYFEFSSAQSNNKSIGLSSADIKEIIDYPTTIFDSSVSSSIIAPHNETYNFNPDEDFTIAMHINPAEANGYLLSKSTTKTLVKTPINAKTNTTGSSQPFNTRAGIQYPFEIFIDDKQHLTFRKSDGNFTPTISASIYTGSMQHVVCMSSASQMEIWITGSKIVSTADTTISQTQNQANLYVGSKGEIGNYYTGSLANVMIFNSSRTPSQIINLYSSSNGSPYVGNIFYSNGLATITHPNHLSIAQPFESSSVNSTYPTTLGGNLPNNIGIGNYYLDVNNPDGIEQIIVETPIKHLLDHTIKFKNIHPIYENEYMCTINSDEYNFTHNISTRKIGSDQKPELANFATGSLWKPYVTTVGLYNENNELLVIGKLGQPVRMSEESDTTFVLRWDT